MRVLVTWGSKRGGTEGIARMVGEALVAGGHEPVLLPATNALREKRFDAVVVGGALYANRWHPAARRFVWRRRAELRKVPVWFFSSGPLDDSADRRSLPPPRQVRALAELVGAQEHVTFGGRLAFDARGFPASAMAKTHAGDWRNPQRIRAWATDVGRALSTAVPRPAEDPRAASLLRLAAHAVAGWAACGLLMAGLLEVGSLVLALWLHALLAPLIFVAVAWHYFRLPGAREARFTAIAFTAIVALLDLVVVAGLGLRSPAMFGSLGGTWVPLLLIFLATWATGEMASTLPWTAPGQQPGQHMPDGAGA
jgi:menaquinone-dependent protoporphyrinogen oxidase